MEITTRKDALAVLDLTENADEDAVKNAYREMIKRYHPDENPGVDTRACYDNVQAAYRFLQENPAPKMRVFGNTSTMETEAARRRERMLHNEKERRREMKEKREQKERLAKAGRKKAFEQEEARYREEAEAREKEYEEAMKQIQAIRNARALEAFMELYRENGNE